MECGGADDGTVPICTASRTKGPRPGRLQLLRQHHHTYTLCGQLQNAGTYSYHWAVHIVTIGLEMWNSRLSIGLPFTDLRLSAMSSAGLQERRSETVCRTKGRPGREQGRPTDLAVRVTGLAAHGQRVCSGNRREQRCSSTHS
jgi:hypothetical protein